MIEGNDISISIKASGNPAITKFTWKAQKVCPGFDLPLKYFEINPADRSAACQLHHSGFPDGGQEDQQRRCRPLLPPGQEQPRREDSAGLPQCQLSSQVSDFTSRSLRGSQVQSPGEFLRNVKRSFSLFPASQITHSPNSLNSGAQKISWLSSIQSF